MKAEILPSCTFGVMLCDGLVKALNIKRAIILSGLVKLVIPLHGCPPHGMVRICIAIENLIGKNIVLVLECSPVIQTDL